MLIKKKKEKMSKGNETAGGLSHTNHKELNETRHQWWINILQKSFLQLRDKVPAKELTEDLPPFSGKAPVYQRHSAL